MKSKTATVRNELPSTEFNMRMAVSLDGDDCPDVVLREGDGRRLDLSEKKGWDEAAISVTLDLPKVQELDQMLFPGCVKPPVYVPKILLRGSPARLAVAMISKKDNKWNGRLVIRHGQILKGHILTLLEVVDEGDKEIGRCLGMSSEWPVSVEEPYKPFNIGLKKVDKIKITVLDNLIEIKHRRFGDPDVTPKILNRCPKEPYFLYLNGEQKPTLYLNTDIDDIIACFHSKEANSPIAKLNRAKLAQDVWKHILLGILMEINRSNVEMPATPWKNEVLRGFLSSQPNQEENEEALLDKLIQEDAACDLINEVESFVLSKCQSGQAVENAIKEIKE